MATRPGMYVHLNLLGNAVVRHVIRRWPIWAVEEKCVVVATTALHQTARHIVGVIISVLPFLVVFCHHHAIWIFSPVVLTGGVGIEIFGPFRSNRTPEIAWR